MQVLCHRFAIATGRFQAYMQRLRFAVLQPRAYLFKTAPRVVDGLARQLLIGLKQRQMQMKLTDVDSENVTRANFSLTITLINAGSPSGRPRILFDLKGTRDGRPSERGLEQGSVTG